ncbi:thioesterase family protein [Ideonella sp. A 288]|uniref:acyl-CoA thioesterase n=1 Tax=Ideonella sp. A 288 TaxID=1962181 RepID=UPI000B4AA414|nr:thioesterase family protein [Ideonella sp. A 288]
MPERQAHRPAVFEREVLIRFGHCDPAGIVFFPQYLVLFNYLVEDWMDQGLKLGYAHFIDHRRIGLPTVSLHCDFTAPSRMGEHVTMGLAVHRLGRKSITLDLWCRLGDEQRVKARQVLVTTQLDRMEAVDIPADLRAAIDRGHPAVG